MKTLANIISVLFHPLALPTYAFVMIYFMNPLLFANYNEKQLSQIFLMVVINTFIFPAFSIFLVWKLGFVKSLAMDDAKERLDPFIVSGVFYIWAYVVFRKSGLPQILDVVILGATITLFAIFMINLFRKVSLHAGGMGSMIIITLAMCMITGANFNLLLFGIVLLAGIVGTCRIFLNAHDTYEVFTGYLIGMVGMMVAIEFY
ncbi:MAG: hypothetical protein LH473_09365 [Chitinophagales bacterium]|nr:hypothetical protein [Chitinophagales bacterium]